MPPKQSYEIVTDPTDLTSTDEEILDELQKGARTKGALVDETGRHRNTIGHRLDVLDASGVISEIHGPTALYELVADPRQTLPEIEPRKVSVEGATIREGADYTVKGPVPNLWDVDGEYEIDLLAMISSVGDSPFGVLVARGKELSESEVHYVPGGEFIEAVQDGRVQEAIGDE